jgi:hypothetical protein
MYKNKTIKEIGTIIYIIKNLALLMEAGPWK